MKHGDTRTRVLLHVVQQGSTTVRAAAEAVDRSVARTHRHLTLLRDEGLVEWDEGRQATIRPCVRPVPFDDGSAA